MRIAFWINLTLFVGFVFAILITGLVAELAGGVPALVTFALLTGGTIYGALLPLKRRLWRRVSQKLQAVYAAGDRAGAARLFDRIEPELTRAQRSWVAVYRAMLPLLDEEWHAGLVALRAIDMSRVGGRARLPYDNAVAWALIHDGAVEEGLGLARQNLETARAAPALAPELRAALVGTLGVALVRAGSHEAGRAQLVEAIAAGGTPRNQCVRHFYLGDAERALGHAAAAEAAYQQATRLCPGSAVAQRAAERLESAPPVPYR